MKVLSTVLTSALLLSGCSQISEHFYSKRNFNSQAFETEIAESKRQLSRRVDGLSLFPPLTRKRHSRSSIDALRKVHSITSSARARIDCGTVGPSAFAVLKVDRELTK